MRILVDCTESGKNADLLSKYAVKGFPTTLFLDSEGTVLQEERHEAGCAKCGARYTLGGKPDGQLAPCQKCGGALKGETIHGPVELRSHEAERVKVQFAEIATKFARPARWQETLALALETAKAGSKPLVVFVGDGKPATEAYAKALDDKVLDELFGKMVFVRLDSKKDAADAKRFGTSAPVLYVVDAAAEKPEAKPWAKISGKKSAADLRKDLEAALKKATQ